MMHDMRLIPRSRLVGLAFALVTLIGPVLGHGRAAWAFDTDLTDDARLNGYKGKGSIGLDVSPAKYYLLLGGMGIVCITVMFKDAKRSHLD